MRAAAEQVRWVPIEEIKEEENLLPEADSGDVVILTERSEGGYVLLAGRDRLHRLRAEGQLCVGAVLNPSAKLDEKMSALLDQLVRGAIHYLDEAKAYRELLNSGAVTIAQLSERIGRTPATIRRKLRLLELGGETERILRHNGLCERYAQELLRLPGQQGRLRVLKYVTDGGLNMKETEKLIDDVLSRMPVPMNGGRRLKPLMRDYRLYLNAVRGIVEQMTDAGLDASMQVRVGQSVAEVRISVPLFARAKQDRCP